METLGKKNYRTSRYKTIWVGKKFSNCHGYHQRKQQSTYQTEGFSTNISSNE